MRSLQILVVFFLAGIFSLANDQVKLVDGKFGKALDTRGRPVALDGEDRYRTPPLTVECWAKLDSKSNFNVLVSCDPKESSRHWELYSYTGSGNLSVYLPGYEPSEIISNQPVCDGQWHHVAFTFDGKHVELFFNGKIVKSTDVKLKPDGKAINGSVYVGQAVGKGRPISCDGLIDDVRISNTIRKITVPKEELKVEADTIALLQFNTNEGLTGDPQWTPPPIGTEPWQLKTDKDWVDGRLQHMDTGPTFGATFDYVLPSGKVRVYRGTAVKLDPEGKSGMLFDRNQLRVAAVWTGGFLNHSSRRFGLLNTPTPAGTIAFGTSALFGWANDQHSFDRSDSPMCPLPPNQARFRSIHYHNFQVLLRYDVYGAQIMESYQLNHQKDYSIFNRYLHIEKSSKNLRCLIAESPVKWTIENHHGENYLQAKDEKGITAIRLLGKGKLSVEGKNWAVLNVSDDESVNYVISVYKGNAENIKKWFEFGKEKHDTIDLQALLKPSQGRYPQPLESVIEIGQGSGPLVVDNFPPPFENPHKALFFIAGVDLFPNGKIAVCTAHGDVWIVELDEKNKRTKWRRFATGLYQPLGLKIVDGKIYVTERGQLTRLHDYNSDGEADEYEAFADQWYIGGGEHSYDTCLERDPQGNFYLYKTGDDFTPTGGTLLKISSQGAVEIFSTGFRHPIGLGISPSGMITGADQEGNWVPSTHIDVMKKGSFHGDMRTHHRKEPPKSFDEPLVWLPKEADNSAGGQIWIPEGKWGSLGGKMLHLSYGRCRTYLVLQEANEFRAAVVNLGLTFKSGVCRAAFSSQGDLYLVGLNGWQTAAVQDGCLQRVRYQPQPFVVPIDYQQTEKGFILKFDIPLDPKSLTMDKCSYQCWNYKYSAEYGSKDWSVLKKDFVGRDTIMIDQLKPSPDGKTLEVVLKSPPRAMQTRFEYEFKSSFGDPIKAVIYSTRK